MLSGSFTRAFSMAPFDQTIISQNAHRCTIKKIVTLKGISSSKFKLSLTGDRVYPFAEQLTLVCL
jgi:hypothetical protein